VTSLIWSKTQLQPVDFFFLLKRRRFDFFKIIGIDPSDPVTQSKPGTRVLDQIGFKNYGISGQSIFTAPNEKIIQTVFF
jgi:hypothetical protein